MRGCDNFACLLDSPRTFTKKFAMKLSRWILAAVLTALLPASAANAWNKAGHMLTGAIAYEVLKRDHPRALGKVLGLLKQHPHFVEMWKPKLDKVHPAQRDMAILMLAARWPDDIRDDKDYDHPKWHYIDYPYKPAGQPASVKTVDPPPVNALAAYRENYGVLQSDAAPREKAVALCWIFHLVGDIHQPLHTVGLFTTEFPRDGDQGGTRFMVRTKAGNEAISLHRFWDELVIHSDEIPAVRKRAYDLLHKTPRTKLSQLDKEVAVTDYESWIQESLRSAKRSVYRSGKLAGSADPKNAPVLPADYDAKSTPIAQRRLLLASYRLADVLDKMLP